MQRYLIHLSYNGTAYNGWQTQPNAPSVQETLEKCLSVLLAQPVSVTGAGRTDTGVHAEMMAAHFDVDTPIENPSLLVGRLNSFLPKDIAVKDIAERNLHARFDAVSRTYEYRIAQQKNPFLNDLAYYFHGNLDFELMNEAARTLFDYTDFTSFSKLHTNARTNNCRIMQAEWAQRGEQWVFTICANRFLRNMVRAIVGTLLEVGKGQMTVAQFRGVVEAKDRRRAGTSAPACGLYLVEVKYNGS